MKVWIILESYTDYKGGNATSFGAFKTKESAIENLSQAVIGMFEMGSIEEWEDTYGECFEDYMALNRESWTWDRGDDVIEFYIQEDELED